MRKLQATAHWVASQTGWRRAMLCLFLGGFAVLALPPAYSFPALMFSVTGLIWILDGSGRAAQASASGWRWRKTAAWQAFSAGWLFGIGFFAVGLYWINFSLTIDFARHGWLIPFSIIGFAGGLGLFTAFTALSAHLLWWRRLGGSGVGRLFVLAAAWVFFEWLRSWIFTGFPWNLAGTAWLFSDAVIQSASIGGVFFLSLLAVFVSGLPAVLADNTALAKATVIGGILTVAVIWGAGQWRLANIDVAFVKDVTLRVVQGNIPQSLKWKEGLARKHFEKYLSLSQSAPPPGAPVPSHVIWPESAAPFPLRDGAQWPRLAGQILPEGGILLTGTNRLARKEGSMRAWNSMVAVNRAGDVIGSYDKFHLVPFGEYLPGRSILGALGMSAIVASRFDFSTGPGPVSLNIPGAPAVSPLICYEGIFPGNVIPDGPDDQRPGWLLNLTNDAWFGNTAGPHQHLAAVQLRAVEEGLPLVRAANTGISSIIDPYGREMTRLGLGETGYFDTPLPKAIAPPFYARNGNLLLFIFLALFALMPLAIRRKV